MFCTAHPVLPCGHFRNPGMTPLSLGVACQWGASSGRKTDQMIWKVGETIAKLSELFPCIPGLDFKGTPPALALYRLVIRCMR